MQVADDAPGARQALAGVDHRLHEVVPGRRRDVRREARDQGAVLGEQCADGGSDVFGRSGVETRQPGKIQQWVHV
jgi:hypothetical protein